MSFDQTNTDITTLTVLANAVVGACQSAQAEAKSANDALTAGDTDISGKLQNIISILQPFAPVSAAAPLSDAPTEIPPAV